MSVTWSARGARGAASVLARKGRMEKRMVIGAENMFVGLGFGVWVGEVVMSE